MKNNLLSIQKFSELSGVEASKLRFYDNIGLLSPIKRDLENNYRYYSPVQLLALNFITTLSDLNLPLKTISELRKQRSPEKLLQLLDQQEKQLDIEIQKLRIRSSIIHARRELINYGLIVSNGFKTINGKRVSQWSEEEGVIEVNETVVSILHREEKEFHLWPRNEYKDGDTFIEPLAAFVRHSGEHHVNLSFPVGGYFDSIESFLRVPDRPDHFISIDPFGKEIRKEGDYVTGFARGYYGEMGDLPEKMDAYIKENSLTVSGPVYVMYLHEECSTQEPSQYLAQASIAVLKPKRKIAARL
jgi:DNA-binding transcriptional MerR regulator/effector-binding domain-containing protein